MQQSRCNTVGFRLIFALALLLSAYLRLQPATGPQLPHPTDLLWHAAGFLVLSLLAWRSMATPHIGWLAVATLALYGGILELLQHWIPGRSPSWLDWLADIAGILLGALLVWWFARTTDTQEQTR